MGNGNGVLFKRRNSIGFSDINLEIQRKKDYTSLHEACMTGDRNIVDMMLKKGYDIQARDKEKKTPLHIACQNGSASLIEYLLSKGSNPNSSDMAGLKPLHYAAKYGHYHAVDEVLKWCKHIEPTTISEGWTPLHLAIFNQHTEVIRLLLSHGADINRKDKSGSTPLHAAALVGDLYSLEIIINNNGDVSICDYHGFTALDYAAQQGHSKCIQYLVAQGANVHLVDTLWKTPLHKCCEFNHPEAVKILMKSGAATEVLDKLGQTPLLKACAQGHVEVVKVLLDHKANIESSDSEGLTALHLAARSGNSKLVSFLLERGIMVNILDSKGNTAFHIACQHKNFAAGVVLLENGARPEIVNSAGIVAYFYASVSSGRKSCVDPALLMRAPGLSSDKYRNRVTRILKTSLSGELHLLRQCKREVGLNLTERDNYGETALHYTCRLGYADMTVYLLNQGADIFAQDTWGFTPLHVACEGNHSSLLRTLLQTGIDINISSKMGITPLHLASYYGSESCFKKLLKYGASIHNRDKLSRDALYFACLAGHESIARLLLASNADPNIVDLHRNSLLHIAAAAGNAPIILSLLASGAHIEAVNQFGKTPLHVACEYNQMNAVIELIQAGANPSAQSKWGLTPLHCCCLQGFTPIALYLLQLAQYYPCADPLVFLFRNPAPRKPNDRRVIDSDEVKELKLKMQEDYNLRAVDHNGNTPLHCACFRGHKECAIALLERGAQFNALNKFNCTPIEYFQNPEIRRALNLKGEKIYRLIRQLMRLNDIPLEQLPTQHSSNKHPSHKFLESSSKQQKQPLSSDQHQQDSPSTTSEQFHETLNKLRLLSLINSPDLPPLSLEDTATHLLHNAYEKYLSLKKENLNNLYEGYELFKEFHYDSCLHQLQSAYRNSCLLEFIERNYFQEISFGVEKEMKIKKSLIEKLEEEREEMKLTFANNSKGKRPLPPPSSSSNEIFSSSLSSLASSSFSASTSPLSGLVYYQCGLIKIVQEHQRYDEEYIENYATQQEKYEHESRRDSMFKVTKKCLGILLGCAWEQVKLTRESRQMRGGGGRGGGG